MLQEQIQTHTQEHAHHNMKNDILKLLSLKQGIYEYEHHPKETGNTIRTDSDGPFTSNIETSNKNKLKQHRKVLSKSNHEQVLENRKKTQSERLFKKREVIQMNKKELLRGSHHLSTRKKIPYLESKGTTLNERFNSIQMKKNKEKSRQTLYKRAQTISYAKMKVKGPNDISATFTNQLQLRLHTFLAKYRHKYQVQKSNMKEVDQQHKNIENLVNQLRNGQDANGGTCNDVPEEKPQQNNIKTNGDIAKRVGGKQKTKEKETLKGLLKERYQIIQRIGKGLSGEVYKGKDILSDKIVAIKVSDLNAKKESQYEFYKKVQHKHIVNYLNNFTSKTKRFLVLQYLPLNLEALSRKRKLNDEEVKKILRSIGSALMFLHGLAIAHRDIKMENIICSQDLTSIKFIDFGLCIDINEENSQVSKEFCGTISYMPPQILQRRPYDPKKADIWSLGVLLYKLCFDRFPYRGRDEREMLIKISKTKLVFPEYCNEDLKSLIGEMLRRDVGCRLTILEVIEHRWLL